MTAAASDWIFSATSQTQHAAWASQHGRLFASAAWAGVLRTLGAETLFGWDAARGVGLVVPVFRRLGLRIGFLGFPIAGADYDALDAAAFTRCAAQVAAAAGLDVVRAAQSMRTAPERRATSGRPEAWIVDLPQWRSDANKRLRKDLAFARRSAPQLAVVQRDFDGAECFALYAATVRRHDGAQRYTAPYFAALAQLAAESNRVGFFAATEGGRVRGFGVVALHAGIAYYLHGAVDDAGRRQGISDLLLERLVDHARDAGATCFSLMASPWQQPGLLRFKQKWANRVGLALTYDCAGSLPGRAAVLVSRWQGRHDGRRAQAFMAQRDAAGEG